MISLIIFFIIRVMSLNSSENVIIISCEPRGIGSSSTTVYED